MEGELKVEGKVIKEAMSKLTQHGAKDKKIYKDSAYGVCDFDGKCKRV